MSLDLMIFVTVTFFSGKRKIAPCIQNKTYRPHLVVKGDDEYLGVCFIDGAVCEFDKAVRAATRPIYQGVGYGKLKPQTQFFVMEGAGIVGEGIVESISPHVPCKEFDGAKRTW